MEHLNNKNLIENLACTNEEIHSLPSCENAESHEVISENVQSSSNETLSDINSANDQHICDVENFSENNSEAIIEENSQSLTEVNTEAADDNIVNRAKDRSDDFEVTINNSETAKPDIISEGNEEYDASLQEEGTQTTEYVEEFALEQTETPYTSDLRNESYDSTEGLESTEGLNSTVVQVDSDRANAVSESNIQNVSDVLKANEINDSNLMPENPEEQVNDENLSKLQQRKDDLINIKDEHRIPSNVEDNNENVNNPIHNENMRNEESVEENVANLSQENNQNMEKGLNESDVADSCEVKKENHSMIVDECDTVLNREQEADNMNESIIHEQVVCNDEVIERVDVGTMSTISYESYTVAEGENVTEIQEGEYTIVEGPNSLEMSASQVDESATSEETWVLLSEENQLEASTEEDNEAYMNELRNESLSRQSECSQLSENKPRRGRKPTYDIPMHVLGHDISKPVETVTNGRSAPKPRLGVKVPYRNLTSQIVSKADIEKEVMERARLKQEQTNSKADILFARKLTQRLARKIAPSPDPPKKLPESKKPKEANTQVKNKVINTVIEERQETEHSQSQDNSKIHNDSDLLAILEGEGDEMPVLPKEVPQPQIDDSTLKMLEREIALQQLQELPNQAPKHRIYKGRLLKSEAKAPVLISQASVSSKTSSTDKSNRERRESTSNQNSMTKATVDQSGHVLSDKENESTKRHHFKDTTAVSPKADQSNVETIVSSPRKQPVEIEPQVKVNMVLKTYSRKRKTIELPEALIECPQPKKTMLAETEIKTEKPDSVTPTNVYVTKSSRVIKKKVIWDPDEAPTRSPKPVTKPDTPVPKIMMVKTVKPVEKTPTLEKVSEKKHINEKVVKEKFIEKKVIEKVTPKRSASVSNEKKVIVLKTDTSKNKIPVKNKKNRSEVDKLLMDEGAVKMLYELKNNDETQPRKKKDVYSVEKAHKEIMKKANEIKSDLQQNTSNESPKSLRKKDSLTPSPVKPAQITYSTERKMSKDSTRSSVHTPPGSPAYSFSHSQSSMLVRRRSSSSISSSDEVDENDVSKSSKKRSLAAMDTSKTKKQKKNEPDEVLQNPEISDPPEKSAAVENKIHTYKSFSVKKTSKHVTIDLNYITEKCFCTVQVLEELTAALKKFAKERDCHVVSITSSSKAFCLGLDYTSLISDNEDERKEKATDLAEKVRDFLLCILKFPKVLIAGIQGDCIGLGVTMLPLFDMVIASDIATFSTPYASLGCVAEGGFLLSPPTFTSHGLAAELLYNTQKITADDAYKRGLVTRLCWPEKYNETLKNIVISISRGSKQSLLATKKQLRGHLLQATEAAINSETKVMMEHWISSECQKNFAQINENTVE